MKQRFTLLDIISAVDEINQECVGLRVSNVYDINKKTYLIRLGGALDKKILLIEYGVRVHLTNYTWSKNMFPSAFTMKCRKTIGNRRLKSVKKIGADRVVDFQFGSDANAFHLIVELYDKGNLIVTDYDYSILHLCRQRKMNDEIETPVIRKYDLSSIREWPEPINKNMIQDISASFTEKSNLKKIICKQFPIFGSYLIEHCLIEFGFSSKTIIGVDFSFNTDNELLYKVLQLAESLLTQCANGIIKGGYMIKTPITKNSIVTYINDEFHSLLFNQHSQRNHVRFERFCDVVDEFYSQIEHQKTELQLINREKTAHSKVQNVIEDHQNRLKTLENEQILYFETAEIIYNNHEIVDDVILLINSALANRMSWSEIDGFITEAKLESHPLASVIDYTKFAENKIALLLKNSQDEFRSILVDLEFNAFSNAKCYFDNRRTTSDKIERTAASHNTALASAKKRMHQVFKENIVTVKVKKNRKPNWFERYRWFISSENYLVIAGRDAQDNEFLVKRHTNKNDIFVHADLHGAAVVVIKVQKDQIQDDSNMPVPIKTLHEAASFAICFSSAWESHLTIPAYWVRMNQVLKTAPTGEYLSVGGFSIRGKKNFIQHPVLLLGIAIMFKIDQDSVKNHVNDRLPKWEDGNKTLTTENYSVDSPAILNPVLEDLLSSVGRQSHFDDDKESYLQSKVFTKIINKKTSLESSLQTTNKTINNDENDIEKSSPSLTVEPNIDIDKNEPNPSQFKRGQKSRYKTKKLKYKDQDEEEREIAEKLLHISLKSKTSKKQQKLLKSKEKLNKPPQTQTQAQTPFKKPIIVEESKELDINSDDDDNEPDEEEKNFLSTFVGNVHSEDQLLHALLICAPYSTLLSYKYKIKITPGTTKRGKAIKTCLNMFSSVKDSAEEERALISRLKDEDHTRRIPTNLKISAPNMIINKAKCSK